MKLIRLKGIIQSFFCTLYQCILSISVLLSVLAMIATDAELDSFTVFTLVSGLAVLKFSINAGLSVCFFGCVEAKVGLSRMQKFLEEGLTNAQSNSMTSSKPLSVHYKGRKYTPEVVRLESFRKERPSLLNCSQLNSPSCSGTVGLSLDKISCNWSDETGRQTLKNISLSVTGGQLVVVTGPVGSGKSSLLMAILGELPINSGEMSCVNNAAYVSQIPWVFSGTVRENIVFGRPFDEDKYHKALQVCDLLKDISHFAKGDLTRIGERGVSLSGGQRARVSLARAVYSEAEVYLLDDPLSAVDTKVGKHLFESCICGMLSGRLRVLATHQLQYLKMADHIVVLQEGSVVEEGSYGELKHCDVLSKAVQLNTEATSEARGSVGAEIPTCVSPVGEGSHKDLEEDLEDRMVGSVTWRLYWNYFRAGLPAALVITLFLFCLFLQGLLYGVFEISRYS